MTYFQKKIYKVTTWYWVECHEKNMYHALSSAQILVKYKITKFNILGNYNSKLKQQGPTNTYFSKCNWMPQNTVGFFVSTYCHHCETYKGFLGDLKWSPLKMQFFMLLLVLQKWILIVNLQAVNEMILHNSNSNCASD